MASVRAWNDWHLEAWAGAYPDRIIPCQLPWLLDPEVGAKMIYENAERGFHAMTFSENPALLGLPTIHSGLLGADDGGLRGHRHGGEPAHRVVGYVTVDHRRRAARRGGRVVLRLRHLRGRRLAVLRRAAAGTRTSRSACPRAESAGWQVCSTGWTTC